MKSTSNDIKRSKKKSTRDRLESKQRRTEKGKLLKIDGAIVRNELDEGGFGNASNQEGRRFGTSYTRTSNLVARNFIGRIFIRSNDRYSHGLDWARLASDMYVTDEY